MRRIALTLAGLVLANGWLTSLAFAQQQPISFESALGLHSSDYASTKLHSTVNGGDYVITVSLPKSYATSSKRYPVLYLLDGNENVLQQSMARERLDGEIDDMIVVGVGYPFPLVDDPDQPVRQRWLDYPTPAKSFWEVPPSGGAPAFLRVLTDEVFPFVEGKYRADPSQRGIAGHSLGGFFSMWALFHTEGVFNRYWISSPSLVWDDKVLMRNEAEFAASHRDLKATVFADVGGIEDSNMLDDLRMLGERIQSRGYPSLRWELHVAPDLGHSGAMMESTAYALYALYASPQVTLSTDRLRALSGRYVGPSGETFDLVRSGGDIRLQNSNIGGQSIKDVKLIPTADGRLVLRYVGISFEPKGNSSPVDEIVVSRSFEHKRYKSVMARRVWGDKK